MTEEKEWQCGELVATGPMQWQCDVIRATDEHVVKTVSITPETLPARTKGKKLIWALPTDGSTPKLGMLDQERVINLFKELRKRGKKEKKNKEEEAKAKAAEAAAAEKEPIRYSVEELLALRYAPASTPPLPLTDIFLMAHHQHAHLRAPPGFAAPPGLAAPSLPERAPLLPGAPPPGFSIPPGLLLPAEVLPLPLATNAAAEAEENDEAAWKHAWKLNYMKRLDSLAETAWQNHQSRQAAAM
jgi:hypothetical protein